MDVYGTENVPKPFQTFDRSCAQPENLDVLFVWSNATLQNSTLGV